MPWRIGAVGRCAVWPIPSGLLTTRVLALLPELGIDYARTVICIDPFWISPNFLRWQTTCHHNQAMDLGTVSARRRHQTGPAVHLGPQLRAGRFHEWRSVQNWDYRKRCAAICMAMRRCITPRLSSWSIISTPSVGWIGLRPPSPIPRRWPSGCTGRQHRRRATRRLHAPGTLTAINLIVTSGAG